jgi:RING finger/CHY zinc finger protein 1
MAADAAGPERYGCVHYRRKCKIRAPCCGEVFDCRHCHNEAKDSLEVSIHGRHVVPRDEIKLVSDRCYWLVYRTPQKNLYSHS